MGRRVLHTRAGGREHVAEQHRHPPTITPLSGAKTGPTRGKRGAKGFLIPIPPFCVLARTDGRIHPDLSQVPGGSGCSRHHTAGRDLQLLSHLHEC